MPDVKELLRAKIGYLYDVVQDSNLADSNPEAMRQITARVDELIRIVATITE